MLPISKISYLKVNNKVRKEFPGTKDYKKVWFLNEDCGGVYDKGLIIGGVTRINEIVYYDEFRDYIYQSIKISEREDKLKKLFKHDL